MLISTIGALFLPPLFGLSALPAAIVIAGVLLRRGFEPLGVTHIAMLAAGTMVVVSNVVVSVLWLA
jgi:hypothetical protein